MKDKKRIAQILFFLVITSATFYMVFFQQNPKTLFREIAKIDKVYLLLCLLLGVGFVGMEGIMLHRLLVSLGERGRLHQSIGYSFVGFFYSGITPSATGGQPMQLYYMCKDGRKGTNATVALMIVGLFYKAVMVVVGLGIALWFRGRIDCLLGNYQWFYWLGLLLNCLVVAVVVLLLAFPRIMERCAIRVMRIWNRWFPIKDWDGKKAKIQAFLQGYQDASSHMRKNLGVLLQIFILTFVQRMMLFVIPLCIYKGYGLSGTSSGSIVVLQAAIYLAVDLLPLPGAQGITETIYRSVMVCVFGAQYLMSSLVLSRFANFYFLLLISLVVAVVRARIKKGT